MHPDRVADLESRLAAVADDAKRRWWTDYVKGAQFLGVPMAQVRSIARTWYRELDSIDPVGMCLGLGSHRLSEMKLAGIAIMEHDLVPAGIADVESVERIGAALHGGGYDDWNTCDWLCVKVIGKIVHGADSHVHQRVLTWTDSEVLWQKRAGLVAFVNLLAEKEPSPGFDDAFLAAAATVVTDDRRFAQTAAGWTLRELSHRQPDLVQTFIDRHGSAMSAEALGSARKHLNSGTHRESGRT